MQVATEFYYQRGRTDIVAYTADECVMAVEAKLLDCRAAMHQAFRNRCFANQSYVLLPKTTALRAHCYAGEFDRRQVGICYVEDGGIVVLHPAPDSDPFEPWLAARAKQAYRSGLEQAREHASGQCAPTLSRTPGKA